MDRTVAIVGNGPSDLIPDLQLIPEAADIDVWIGADRGALTILQNNLPLHYAVGDFDSVSAAEKDRIKQAAKTFQIYPEEKDWTDLELAVQIAHDLQPAHLYLFGLSGGRFDHTLINLQLLVKLLEHNISAVMVDKQSQVMATRPGLHTVNDEPCYPHVSFIPHTEWVTGLTLDGFYYPLKNADISWGSTLCISNKLVRNSGTFSFKSGILLIVKSRDL
ncbi:thiamine diphosphokinase [Lentibacillus saliphilus]|uniref:thiamine diphosphokinase n=1 Tax=Lentibacillus saliphilus TaxID=2737028 RepID=UPI001C30B7A7|nr:thiamine diphosphokinase [Lentibacillus saliphilus]